MSLPLPTADARRTRHVLAELVRAHSGGFALAVLALASGAAAGVASPLTLGGIVDATGTGDNDRTRRLLVLLAALVILQSLTAVWSRVAVARVGERMLARLRVRLMTHVLRIPERRVEDAGRGELVARVSGDVAAVGDTVSSVVPNAAAAAFAIIAAAAGMGAIDPRLTLAACVAVPIQWFALRHYLRRSQPVYREARAAAGDRSQHMLEALDAHPTLSAFGITPAAEARVDERARRTADLSMTAVRLGVRFWGRLNLAELVGLGAILVAGFLLVRTGEASLGAATAAALMFLNLFGPIGTVLAGFDDLQRAGASLARLAGVLDEPAETFSAPVPEGLSDAASRHERAAAGPTRGVAAGIEIAGLGHAYGAHVVLADVSLRVRPGEHVAIVGASGAGKSTLAALVCGRLTVQRGRVRITGPSRPRVTLVTQENHVFAGPLADDLRLARPGATDADLLEALARTGAGEWVARLEDGIATPVGAGGQELTDVQRQQLALARVHLLDPDVLVLDEAASEAGSADGNVLDRAVLRMARGRTTITIAHRLEQAKAADRIVVLDAGRVVEEGGHEELLARAGGYAALWAASGR